MIEASAGLETMTGSGDLELPQNLKAFICEMVASVCLSSFGDSLRAIILTGSLARDEATFQRAGEGWTLRGDAEFFLIFHTGAPLPGRPQTLSIGERIEEVLSGRELHARIDLSAVHPVYLQRLPKHVSSYELRNRGRVIYGDTGILALIPEFQASELSREDAWRLLNNRLIELLEILAESPSASAGQPGRLQYRAVKLYLDMATSLLIFAGSYAPGYREREEKLRGLAERDAEGYHWPFDLRPFVRQVSNCTRWKLRPFDDLPERTSSFCSSALDYARLLEKWELQQLTGAEEQFSDADLLRRWMQRQPARKRIRGWLYVLRACGWHRSWRHWPRWIRLARKASPRSWVYAAAIESLARLPNANGSADLPCKDDREFLRIGQWLPVVSSSPSSAGDWQWLATEIATNYHQFLERTRS